MTEAKPHYHGHRDRLRQRLLGSGPDALADYEVIELLLFGAKPRGDVKPLAKALMDRFGNLANVLSASPEELASLEGMGRSSIAAIKIVQEASRRLAREEILDRPVLSSWNKLLDYVRISLAREKVENFHLLFLDRKNRLIADERHTTGSLDTTPVYPRDIVKRALDLNAAALILVHNHPSGSARPSKQDIDLTKQIMETAGRLGIHVHDHIIVGRSDHTSMRSMGLLDTDLR